MDKVRKFKLLLADIKAGKKRPTKGALMQAESLADELTRLRNIADIILNDVPEREVKQELESMLSLSDARLGIE